MELRPIKHSEYDPANQNGGGAVTKNKDLVTSLHVCHAQNPEIKIVNPLHVKHCQQALYPKSHAAIDAGDSSNYSVHQQIIKPTYTTSGTVVQDFS